VLRVASITKERASHHQGMGELHLEIIGRPHEARVQGRRQCRRTAGRLIARRSPAPPRSITSQEADRRRRSVARVKIRFEPLPPGSALCSRQLIGEHGAKEYVPGVEKGLKGPIDTGVLAGFRLST